MLRSNSIELRYERFQEDHGNLEVHSTNLETSK